MTDSVAEMDAFELRWRLVHGLHPSDGLVVHVVDEHTVMAIGTDSTPHPKHGIYLATGRTLTLRRFAGGWLISASNHPADCRVAKFVSDLDADLAWVRQRMYA